MEKVYSKVNEIPKGNASDKLVHGCLVLEGGAFRGMYTQGALDVLMENDLNFDCVIGVSAGALCGLNYVSGQIGRGARTNLKFRHDPRFIGLDGLKKSHSLINLDFLFNELNEIEPMDEKAFYNPKKRFIAVCTDTDDGKTLYFEKGKCHDFMSAVKASASMPFVSREVKVDGYYCLDGGSSCKIAYQWALDNGYDKIFIIKTREASFRKKAEEIAMARIAYPNEFGEVLARSNYMYNEQCEEIEKLNAENKVFVMSPSETVTVSRVEANMEKLGDLYWLGRKDMEDNMEKLIAYLGPQTFTDKVLFQGYKAYKYIESMLVGDK